MCKLVSLHLGVKMNADIGLIIEGWPDALPALQRLREKFFM